VLAVVAVAAGACAGCGQPRSFLDTTVMLQQSRDADVFWGPDGLAGHAPLAQRTTGGAPAPAQSAAPFLAQAGGNGASVDLFPATYRAVRLPRPGAPALDPSTLAVAASPARGDSPSRGAASPVLEAPRGQAPAAPPTAMADAGARPRAGAASAAAAEVSEELPPLPESGPETVAAAVSAPPVSATRPVEKTVMHVTGRPRDDGVMLTSLEEADALPPLPEAAGDQAKPAAADARDADSLPPLPPGAR
jgi:hypothetical protein